MHPVCPIRLSKPEKTENREENPEIKITPRGPEYAEVVGLCAYTRQARGHLGYNVVINLFGQSDTLHTFVLLFM